MKTGAPLTIRSVTSLEAFKGLAREWDALLDRVPGHSLFLTWDWLYSWATHYLGDGQIKIFLAFDGHERLVGIAPLFLRLKRRGVISVRELRFLGSEAVCSSYLDCLAQERHKPAVLRSLYHYLCTEGRGQWDILTLSDLPAESSTLDLFSDLFDQAGKVGEIIGTTCCPVIRLPGDVATYRAGLGRNRRYGLQRKMTRLRKAGRLEFTRATSPAEVEDAFESVIDLHQRRWNGRPGGGVFADARAKRFHREIVRVMSERGRASIDRLLLEGRPIAGIYGFTYRGVYYFYLPGFDPDVMPQASPGQLLLHHRIEQALGDGEQMVDLLQGAAPYKLEWSNDVRRSITVRWYNRSARAVAFKLLESGKQAVKIFVR